MHDLCCIGHITLDKIVTPKNTVHMAGGTAFLLLPCNQTFQRHRLFVDHGFSRIGDERG